MERAKKSLPKPSIIIATERMGHSKRSIVRQFRMLCSKVKYSGTRKVPLPMHKDKGSENWNRPTTALYFSMKLGICPRLHKPNCYECYRTKPLNESVATLQSRWIHASSRLPITISRSSFPRDYSDWICSFASACFRSSYLPCGTEVMILEFWLTTSCASTVKPLEKNSEVLPRTH